MAVRKNMGLPAAVAPIPEPVAELLPIAGAASKSDARAGRVQFGGWIPHEAKAQIDLYCFRNRQSKQWVLEEALNLFFTREQMQRIARAEDKA